MTTKPKPILGEQIIYAGGDVQAALDDAKRANVLVTMDDIMHRRLAERRPIKAKVTRVIDDETVDLELQDVLGGEFKQRFDVKYDAAGATGTWSRTAP